MTGSRGALLGLVAALIAAPFVVGRGRRAGVAALAALTVLAGAAFIVTVVPDAISQRVTRVDTSGSGRRDIWRMGLRIVDAHPVTGVGRGTSRLHRRLPAPTRGHHTGQIHRGPAEGGAQHLSGGPGRARVFRADPCSA